VDIHSAVPIEFNSPAGKLASFVGGVVKDLDFELLTWIVQPGHRVDEPLHHVHFIEYGKLHRHRRKPFQLFRRTRPLITMLVIEVDHQITMAPVESQRDENREVNREYDGVEQTHISIFGFEKTVKSSSPSRPPSKIAQKVP
jgi:hypothetical protein